MEERQLKRLLIIVAVSIAIIMGFKMMLTDSLTTMNQAAAEKKRITPSPPQPAIEPPVLLEPVFFPPAPVETPVAEIIEPLDNNAGEPDSPATSNEDTHQP